MKKHELVDVIYECAGETKDVTFAMPQVTDAFIFDALRELHSEVNSADIIIHDVSMNGIAWEPSQKEPLKKELNTEIYKHPTMSPEAYEELYKLKNRTAGNSRRTRDYTKPGPAGEC